MADTVRGTKRRCPHCGAPFYDLNHTPIICPKCDTEVRPEAVAKVPVRASRAAARAPRPEPIIEDVEAFEEDEVLAGDEVEDEDEAEIEADESGDGDEMRE